MIAAAASDAIADIVVGRVAVGAAADASARPIDLCSRVHAPARYASEPLWSAS